MPPGYRVRPGHGRGSVSFVFVAGPNGAVVPDVARKLPGRGLWAAASRASIDTAVRKGLFARAAKTRLTAPSDLSDQTTALLLRRLLSFLGLARKAGELTFGFAKVLSAIEAGRAAHLIEAIDGAADGRRKLLAAARRTFAEPSAGGALHDRRIEFGPGR